MSEPIQPGAPVPVVAATKERLWWRALGTWVQAFGATLAATIIAISNEQPIIAPLVPIKYTFVAAAIFAVGKVIESVQKQKDMARTTEVNLSGTE